MIATIFHLLKLSLYKETVIVFGCLSLWPSCKHCVKMEPFLKFIISAANIEVNKHNWNFNRMTDTEKKHLSEKSTWWCISFSLCERNYFCFAERFLFIVR